MKRVKKFVFLTLATALLVAPTASFADSTIIDPEEGVGISVDNPTIQNEDSKIIRSARATTTQGKKVSVSGGTLWATWSGGSFKANYYHGSKTHRASAMNDNKKPLRGDWTGKGMTAESPWNYQTLYGNRVFGATK
ncbi:hypothetical protein LZ906_014630 [Paraclostridium ghonii]|uniref:hypothetical protein n=1 Tax=Paraclostridium ghonii TaxID=29358 RepID=UPI00202D071F|nr:hypothetical protein [Paeniclostridium ghonii]MCM0167342.1 hypothetical protein [Paeniclostridium ghonii]